MPRVTKSAFTLIELLVVIAIIGLLASIVLAALSSGRAKGRDARRVADLHQIATTLSINDSGGGVSIACSNNSLISTCTFIGTYGDPNGGSTLCSKITPRACQYTVFAPGGVGITTENFEVCAYLESGSGPLSSGNVSVSNSTTTPTAGCL